MFDKLSKNQKVIFYFLIGVSFIFVIPILFWIGFFIGYNTCKNSIKIGVETFLETKDTIDNNYLEINI